jgi:hypothetical protein
MLLRSGTVVTNNVAYQSKPAPKCSYCNKPGHKINNCNNTERIKKINDGIVERTIFSLMVIPYNSIVKKYLRLCLCGLSETKLLMLCYYTKTKKYSTQDKKSSYINLLVDYYYEKLDQNLNTLIFMLSVISDENYEKYTDEILNNSVSLNLTFETEEMIVNTAYKYRPPQRKFNIQLVTNPQHSQTDNNDDCPICYETYPNAELIRTDCGHNYCKDCLTSYFKSLNNNNNSPTCACCRKVITTLEIRNKKTCEEIQKKYCNDQLAPPPEPSRPPEPATPPPQAPPQQTIHGTSTTLQRIIFYFVAF